MFTHDIAEILLKLVLNTNQIYCYLYIQYVLVTAEP